ncbi:hypothetical protein AC578_6567 [Pseudocercospora eumusae]|uniref:Uncharacterized protein n=1 Tax=Pseudocercospora eumusae TaxID=321146 RepID=A0A139HHY7_9PEZI|nr:hypothetical protein AC578_6567 [Pseudocercospora eumusae]
MELVPVKYQSRVGSGLEGAAEVGHAVRQAKYIFAVSNQTLNHGNPDTGPSDNPEISKRLRKR